MMDRYGGAVFLLSYLLLMCMFGVPALMAEWALGRHTRGGPSAAFVRVGMPGGRYFSCLLMLTVVMGSSYYGVVVGWVLYFAVAFGVKAITPALPTDFDSLSGSVGTQSLFVVAAIAIACAGLLSGVRKGIERVSRIALPIFFILFAILVVRVLTLEGAGEGLSRFLVPRWDNFTGATPLAALGQVFFSLGLGGTFMVAYGSYMSSQQDIPKTAIWTAGADVSAALMAGLIVIPAAVAFDIPAGSGIPLMFDVMPRVFGKMPLGILFGTVFFVSVFVVALLSLMAAYETLVIGMTTALNWSRPKSLAVIMAAMCVLAIPAGLSTKYIEYSDLLWGTTMQPVGGAIAVVALAWCLHRAKALDELRANSSLPVPGWLYHWIKYGIPLGILATLVYGWASL